MGGYHQQFMCLYSEGVCRIGVDFGRGFVFFHRFNRDSLLEIPGESGFVELLLERGGIGIRESSKAETILLQPPQRRFDIGEGW